MTPPTDHNPHSSPDRSSRSPAERMRPQIRRLAPSAARIRAKLIILHTLFSIALAAALILAIRPPVQKLFAMTAALERLALARTPDDLMQVRGIIIESGTAEELELPPFLAVEVAGLAGTPYIERLPAGGIKWLFYDPIENRYFRAEAPLPTSSEAINNLYLLLTLALLAVYAVIALTLEVFVLPRQVYAPIERLRLADRAVQQGDREAELIPDNKIPTDELGEIMRSRNASILKLREQERALNAALDQIETVAAELKRKNHLLETAKRNLADQDRLASLGMMSAGIAHELNTPLAVLKGTVEQLARSLRSGKTPAIDRDGAELMLRVVRRLERLSESLLDFARVRPPAHDLVPIRRVTEEAWTLVSLDRDARQVTLTDNTPPDAAVLADEDRLTQVFVNLLRNAVDALDTTASPAITITTETTDRDDRAWLSITIQDNGPGIDPSVLPRLFEPFASTRLDASGTGLGLAVAEGIIREHSGVLLARNALPPSSGAIFEIMLPLAATNEMPHSPDKPPTPGTPGTPGTSDSADDPATLP